MWVPLFLPQGFTRIFFISPAGPRMRPSFGVYNRKILRRCNRLLWQCPKKAKPSLARHGRAGAPVPTWAVARAKSCFMDFKLVSDYKPRGDQAAAIQALTRGVFDREGHQV